MTLQELREQLVIDSQVLRGQFERTIQLIGYIDQKIAEEEQNVKESVATAENRGTTDRKGKPGKEQNNG